MGQGVGPKLSLGMRNLDRLSPKVKPIFEQKLNLKETSPPSTLLQLGLRKGKEKEGFFVHFFQEALIHLYALRRIKMILAHAC